MAINLGDVNFNLGADTRNLQSSVNLLKQFGTAVDNAQTQTTQSANATAAAFRKQEAAITSALNQTLRLSTNMRRVKDGETYANEVTRAFQRLSSQMSSGRLSTIQYQRAMEQFRASTGNVSRGFKDFSTAVEGAAGRGQTFRTMLQGLQSSAVLVQGPLGGIATRLTNIGALLRSGAGAFTAFSLGVGVTAYALYKVGSALLETGVMVNKLKAQLVAVTGSQTLAADQLNHLFMVARKTGQSIEDLSPSFAKFEMAAKGAGLSTNEMWREFEGLAMASTKLQLTGEETQGMFKALEQMLSKGTVQAEELRGQLGDRLAGAFNIASAAMGVTTAQLGKMMKTGEVLSNDFLPKFITQLEIALHIDPSKSIDNYAASVNNLNTAWTQFKMKLEGMIGVTNTMMQLNKENTAIIDSWTASLDRVPEALRKIKFFWQAMTEDIKGSNKELLTGGASLWDEYVGHVKGALAELDKASSVSWIEQLHNEIATLNKMLDYIVNFAEATRIAFNGVVEIFASYIIDVMNTMIKGIEEGLNKLFVIIRSRTDDITKLFPSMKSILPYPTDFDTSKPAIINTLSQSWTGLAANIMKAFTVQHHFFDDAEAKIKEWLERAKDLENISNASGPQRRFANNLHANDNVAAAQAEVEQTEKQIKAAERLAEAKKSLDDEIERQTEKLDALGGTEAGLRALNDQFKRDKEVERYAKALRKAGADTQYIAEKSAELAKVLADVDAAEKQQAAVLELRDTFISSFDSISESILSAFEGGKDAAQAFKDTVKKVLNDILDMIIKMALLNPLKNWLFGTDLPTLADAGGLFGGMAKALPGLFGSGSKSGGGAAAAFVPTASSLVSANFAAAQKTEISLPTNTGGSSLLQTFAQPMPQNDNSIGGTMANFAASIRQIESGSFAGNYSALGKWTGGDRAYGAYQVMGNNIPSWTKGATGTSMTPQQFLQNPGAQDSVFAKYFGADVKQYGASGAANKWFTGSATGSGHDINGTTSSKYVQKFESNVKQLGTSAQQAAKPLTQVGSASQTATQGLGNFGNSLSNLSTNLSTMFQGSGAGGGLFGGLFGAVGGLFSAGAGIGGGIGSGWENALGKGFRLGGVFSHGTEQRFGAGDIFSRPTSFPMGGNRTGTLGEAGEEAIMPLTRGSDGKLGIQASNGNTPHVNFTVINNAGVQVSHTKRVQSDGTIDLVAVIDQTVADRLSRRGTDSSNAMRSTFGSKQTLKRR